MPCACSVEVTRDAEAVVLEAEAGAALEKSGGSEPLQRDARVRVGEVLSTSSNAQLAVSLLPGALAEIAGETHLRMDKLRVTKNGVRVEEAMRREIHVTLLNGSLSGCVEFETEQSPVSVASPGGELSVLSPALFRVEAGGERTRVICARGSVQFRPSDGSAALTITGPAVREWPSPPGEAIPAAFDAAATKEIENLQELERKLLGLQSRSRLAPYPWRQ